MQFAEAPSGAYVSDAFEISTQELEPLLLDTPENTFRDRIAEHRFAAAPLSEPAGARVEFWPEEEEGQWTMLVRVEAGAPSGSSPPDSTPPEIEALTEGKEPSMAASEVAEPNLAT